jgi:hypothetical protein
MMFGPSIKSPLDGLITRVALSVSEFTAVNYIALPKFVFSSYEINSFIEKAYDVNDLSQNTPSRDLNFWPATNGFLNSILSLNVIVFGESVP